MKIACPWSPWLRGHDVCVVVNSSDMTIDHDYMNIDSEFWTPLTDLKGKSSEIDNLDVFTYLI